MNIQAQSDFKAPQKRSFFGGMSKKQFITLGYVCVALKRGISPTARNIRDFLEKENVFSDSPKSLLYGNVRTRLDRLQHQHGCLFSMPVTFMTKFGRNESGFYLSKKGGEIIKKYVEQYNNNNTNKSSSPNKSFNKSINVG